MADLIISKARTKDAVKECNVSGEFYEALDKKVREAIAARMSVEQKIKVNPADMLMSCGAAGAIAAGPISVPGPIPAVSGMVRTTSAEKL